MKMSVAYIKWQTNLNQKCSSKTNRETANTVFAWAALFRASTIHILYGSNESKRTSDEHVFGFKILNLEAFKIQYFGPW